MIALFSYVNCNGKYKETRNGILYSYCNLHRKSQQKWVQCRSNCITSRRNFANTQPIQANSKIKSIAIDPGNTLYLLELDLEVIRCSDLFFPIEVKYPNKKDLRSVRLTTCRGVESLCPCQSCTNQNQRHSSGNWYPRYIFWYFAKNQIKKYLKFVKREHFSGATSPQKVFPRDVIIAVLCTFLQ